MVRGSIHRGGRGGGGSSRSFGAANNNSTSDGTDNAQDSANMSNQTVNGACEQRGGKRKSRTELNMPTHAGKIVLEPVGDKQFKYSDYEPKKAYTYTAQLGVMLIMEYPGIVEEKDEHGNVIHARDATTWDDYYLCPDDDGVTHANQVREFWLPFRCACHACNMTTSLYSQR